VVSEKDNVGVEKDNVDEEVDNGATAVNDDGEAANNKNKIADEEEDYEDVDEEDLVHNDEEEESEEKMEGNEESSTSWLATFIQKLYTRGKNSGIIHCTNNHYYSSRNAGISTSHSGGLLQDLRGERISTTQAMKRNMHG
jgi:hypothetical protein